MPYLVEPRDRIFVKGYGFFNFANNFNKNIGKNISKTLSGKYCRKLLDHAKQSVADPFRTISIRVIRKTAEATDDLIGNKIDNGITKNSKSSQQNNSGTITNKHYKEEHKYLQWKDRKLLMIKD